MRCAVCSKVSCAQQSITTECGCDYARQLDTRQKQSIKQNASIGYSMPFHPCPQAQPCTSKVTPQKNTKQKTMQPDAKPCRATRRATQSILKQDNAALDTQTPHHHPHYHSRRLFPNIVLRHVTKAAACHFYWSTSEPATAKRLTFSFTSSNSLTASTCLSQPMFHASLTRTSSMTSRA
jgi:hypothetical protein